MKSTFQVITNWSFETISWETRNIVQSLYSTAQLEAMGWFLFSHTTSATWRQEQRRMRFTEVQLTGNAWKMPTLPLVYILELCALIPVKQNQRMDAFSINWIVTLQPGILLNCPIFLPFYHILRESELNPAVPPVIYLAIQAIHKEESREGTRGWYITLMVANVRLLAYPCVNLQGVHDLGA